jgi:glycosyltransferase involved in cell wall biosynthesis
MSGPAKPGRRPPRVLTSMRSLLSVTGGPEWQLWKGSSEGLMGLARAVLGSFRYDYVFMEGVHRDLLVLALIKRLVPFYPPRLVLLNLLMTAPGESRMQRAKFRLITWLLGGMWKIVQYHRDTRALQQHLGLPASRFDYVPFKINRLDLVERTTPTDEGYVFCGGKTRRDFDTFIAAVEQLPYPVRIVTTSNEDIREHGSFLADDRPMPPNVKVVRLDGSAQPFIDQVAASRLVVLPIKPDICGVGIGVYILGMALGKCVVITEGPTTTYDLTDDLAVMVPPEDPVALREAIRRVYTDDALRSRLGENAYRHAAALAGEERLVADIVSFLERDWQGTGQPGLAREQA